MSGASTACPGLSVRFHCPRDRCHLDHPCAMNGLHLCNAAIHKQFRSRDVAAVVGGEKHHGLGDLMGFPSLPSGTVLKSICQRCSSASAEAIRSFSPGVSMKPGLTAFTRMRRSFKSVVQVRANERTAAFVALYTLFAGNPFAGDDGRIQDDRGAIRQQRQRLLHREQEAFHIDVEDRVIVLLSDLAEGAYFATPAFANTISSCPSPAGCAKRRSRSPRFDTSPWTPVTLLPISLTAAANSGSRRPVMKTYAPSFTNCFAVARPMPLLPPVMRAIFPSSFLFFYYPEEGGEGGGSMRADSPEEDPPRDRNLKYVRGPCPRFGSDASRHAARRWPISRSVVRGVHWCTVQSCMSSALSLAWPLRCL